MILKGNENKNKITIDNFNNSNEKTSLESFE